MADTIPGFVPGIVKEHHQSESGLIRCAIPGLFDDITPYWIMPAGWPGGGGGTSTHQGSSYPPPPIGGQVFVMFCYGQYEGPDSQAIYLTGYYGNIIDLQTGYSPGPLCKQEATEPEDRINHVCIWEDENFIVDISNRTDSKAINIQSKDGNSRVTINTSTGDSGKAQEVVIEGQTLVSIYSPGMIDLDANIVQIQGRRVLKNGGTI